MCAEGKTNPFFEGQTFVLLRRVFSKPTECHEHEQGFKTVLRCFARTQESYRCDRAAFRHSARTRAVVRRCEAQNRAHSFIGTGGCLSEFDFSAPPVLAEDFTFERVNVTALAERVVESFQPHAEYKDQNLRRADFAEEAFVRGDAVRLQEAMKNIVNNALKYSPRGETVEVRVERAEAEVRFSVSDQGPGLREEDLQHLFKPFQRLTAQPTDGEVSLGLGLYLVNEIISRHDGDVDVETSAGEGSTFTLVLPAAAASVERGS